MKRLWSKMRGKRSTDPNSSGASTPRSISLQRPPTPLAQVITVEHPRARENAITAAGAHGIMDDELAQSREEAWLQDDTDILERVKWETADKLTFNGYIEDLKKDIKSYQELLQLKSTESTVPRAPALRRQALSLQAVAEKTQTALWRLHAALRVSNNSVKPWRFSLQLEEHYGQSSQDFVHLHDYLPLSQHAKWFYFMLQRHSPVHLRNPELFVSETREEERLTLTPTPPPPPVSLMANQLQQAEAYAARAPTAQTHFVEWGITLSPNRSDTDMLFKDTRSTWQVHQTLADAFLDPQSREKLTRSQRVQLALLLTISSLYLVKVRPSCQPITLSNYLYYITNDEDTSWDPQNPLILSPYLFFGFGQRPVDLKSGGRRKASSTSATNPLHELGIILVLIGLCELPAPAVSASAAPSPAPEPPIPPTQNWATARLNDLERRIGLPYAEVARECLQFQPPSDATTQTEAQETAEVGSLVGAVTRLEAVKRAWVGSEAGGEVP